MSLENEKKTKRKYVNEQIDMFSIKLKDNKIVFKPTTYASLS